MYTLFYIVVVNKINKNCRNIFFMDINSFYFGSGTKQAGNTSDAGIKTEGNKVPQFKKSVNQVNRTDGLPNLRKGIDSYIFERKKNREQNQNLTVSSRSDANAKRYQNISQKTPSSIPQKVLSNIPSSISELYNFQEAKKRIMMSPNKVIPKGKVMEIFEPYKKQFQKINLRRVKTGQSGQSPFSVALRQLGIVYHFEAEIKNKLIPSRGINQGNVSTFIKNGKQKLKPIIEKSLKPSSEPMISRNDKQFYQNVERMNLLHGELEKRNQSDLQIGLTKNDYQNNIFGHRRRIQEDMEKIEKIRKPKERRGNGKESPEKMSMWKEWNGKRQNFDYSFTKKQSPKVNNTNPNSTRETSQFSFNKLLNISISDRNLQNHQTFRKSFDRFQESESNPFLFCSQTSNRLKKKQKIIQDEFNEVNPNTDKKSTSCQKAMNLPKNRKKKQFKLPFETYYYRDLIWKVNFSNQIFFQTPVEYEHRLKAYIGKGNNSSMILGFVKRRIWFAITDKIEDANFAWTQFKSLPYFKKQRESNRTRTRTESERQKEITKTTEKMRYCTKNQSQILTVQDHQSYATYFQKYISFEQKSNEQFTNRMKNFNYTKKVKVSQIRQQRLQNHLINNYVVGNKKALFNTMSNYYQSIGKDVFNFLPLTFHIKNGQEDLSFLTFLKYFSKRDKQVKSSNEQSKDKVHNVWIVKPGENSNRGNGIQVCLQLDEIKNIIKKKERYGDGSPKTYIIQSYIERPLLYQKRKFDMRHFIMVSCINGNVKGYWYKDGYIRTTSNEYSLKNNQGKVHLTNDAIQKKLDTYGKYEKGNKINYQELQSFINKSHKNDRFSFNSMIYPKMKQISTDVMKASSKGIDPEKLYNNFEIYGLDFMVDTEFNVWLIEVNTNPCLQLSCPLLGLIIPKMIENALELTMDCIFPPPVRYAPKGVHYYKNLEKQNRFEMVYDERVDGLFDSSLEILDGKMLYEEDDTFENEGEEWTEN